MKDEYIEAMDHAEDVCTYLEDLPGDVPMVRFLRTAFKMLYLILAWIVKHDQRERKAKKEAGEKWPKFPA